MRRPGVLAVCVTLLVCDGLACHRKYLADVIVTHINEGRPPSCQREGQPCKYDRNCCARMECKMTDDAFDIVTRCRYRIGSKDYQEQLVGPSWKDYQEMESSEEERLKKQNSQDIEKRNADLRRKLAELEMLKKSISRKQLMDMKEMVEETEIEELKNEKLKYEEEHNMEMERLKKVDLQNKLESLEKKEVKSLLSKPQQNSEIPSRIYVKEGYKK